MQRVRAVQDEVVKGRAGARQTRKRQGQVMPPLMHSPCCILLQCACSVRERPVSIPRRGVCAGVERGRGPDGAQVSHGAVLMVFRPLTI